jgi:hypothetical protein
MKKKIISILIVLMVVCQGCVAAFLAGGAVAGIMVYSYMRGELERKYPSDFPSTWQATMKTVEELEFEVDKTTKDAITGEIQCHRANGTTVWIKLQMDTAEITIVRVRVGTEGDRNISEFIHEKIRQNLKISDDMPPKEK